MDITEFIRKRPFVYHLTHHENYKHIQKDGQIWSTMKIVKRAGMSNKNGYLRKRRAKHSIILINDQEIYIRDQQPLFPNALKKCVTGGWNSGDFIEYLNKRVFFWPTLKRLNSHFKRYQDENPTIIRVNTKELIDANLSNPPMFCRLNSGATRPNSYLGGIAPLRGPNTFKTAENYKEIISSVAEVTFEIKCNLPNNIEVGKKPHGPWKGKTLKKVNH